jgi:leader peptidase (prepilin peptidase) / N-methyltransferase
VGTMQAVGICVATGVGAGVVGWWSRAGGLTRRWVEDARPLSGHVDSRTEPAYRISPLVVWPAFTSAAAAGVAAASLFGRLGPLWIIPFLGVWACGLTLLALVDRETLLIPRKLVHLCYWAAAGVLVANSAAAGEWNDIKRSLVCVLAAWLAFGAWALFRPNNLGLGDVRMACLVALGAGALWPAGCVVALTSAPFLAACVSSLRSRVTMEGRSKPIALGPFLAVAGIVAVVARAL